MKDLITLSRDFCTSKINCIDCIFVKGSSCTMSEVYNLTDKEIADYIGILRTWEFNQRNEITKEKMMSLDISLRDPTATYKVDALYETNITHNLTKMAEEAGIYEALWRPHLLFYNKEREITEDDIEATLEIKARDITSDISLGLSILKGNPKRFEKFNANNGWGTYEHFVPFVENYLAALIEFPKAIVETWR